MTYRRCCVFGCPCKSKSGEEGSAEVFHRFPSDSDTREKWVNFACGGKSGWSPSKYAFVCGCHFREEMKLPGSSRGRLHQFAFPGIIIGET